MKKILHALLLLLCLSLPALAQDAVSVPRTDPDTAQDLAVSVDGRQVQILASDTLLDRAAGVKIYPDGGCSYRIEWGDGKVNPAYRHPAPLYCTSTLRHTYARPGQYLIKVGIAPYNWGLSTMPSQYGETIVTIE